MAKWYEIAGNLGSLFGPVGSLVGAGLNVAGNLFGAKVNQQNQMQLQEHSAGLSQENWQKQFALQNNRQDYLNSNQQSIYANSMRQAGFSPIWQGSGQMASPSVSSPSAPAPSGQASMQNIFGDVAQMALLGAQARNIEADTKKKEADTKLTNTEQEYYGRNMLKSWEFTDAQIMRLGAQNIADLARVDMEYQKLQPEIDEMKQRIALMHTEEEMNIIHRDNLAEQYSKQLDLLSVQANLSRKQIKEIDSKIMLMGKEGAKLDVETKNLAQEWLILHNQSASEGAKARMLKKEADSFIRNHPDAAHYIDAGLGVISSLGGSAVGGVASAFIKGAK